ncbi:MAG: hypothetical protein R2729_11165 [Bryobacteraceae bacterium]
MTIRASTLALAFSAALAAQPGAGFDPAITIALGDALPAGMGDFSLHSRFQEYSFPVLVAKQLGVVFPQPLFEAPGLGGVPGYTALPVRAPAPQGATVRTKFPPDLFAFNLAVPGITVSEAASIRVTPPLVQGGNAKQTMVNYIVGLPSLLLGSGKPLYTQVEAAVSLRPSFVILAYGYSEVIEAAAAGDANRLPLSAPFRQAYGSIAAKVAASFPNMLFVNVPDPMDTAWANTVESIAPMLNASPDGIRRWWNLASGDMVTPAAFHAMGEQLDNGVPGGALPDGSVIPAAFAAAVRARVAALNQEIAALAAEHRAPVYDMAALLRGVRQNGVTVGGRRLTAVHLGGFYTLNGFFPGRVGNALAANGILALINSTHSRQYPLVDAAAIAGDDPAGRFAPTSIAGGAAQ